MANYNRRVSAIIHGKMLKAFDSECARLSVKESELIKIAISEYQERRDESYRRRNGETKGTPSREYGY
jgi:metal-responsive CopG/Arc/MetJ family transcriptional regulator